MMEHLTTFRFVYFERSSAHCQLSLVKMSMMIFSFSMSDDLHQHIFLGSSGEQQGGELYD